VQKGERSKNRTFITVIFFRVINRILALEIDKAVIAGGNNNAGVWGRSVQLPMVDEGSGMESPDVEAIFYSFFFQKIHILGHTLVLISA